MKADNIGRQVRLLPRIWEHWTKKDIDKHQENPVGCIMWYYLCSLDGDRCYVAQFDWTTYEGNDMALYSDGEGTRWEFVAGEEGT